MSYLEFIIHDYEPKNMYAIWHMGIMAVARTYALALGLRPLGLYQFQKKQNTQTFNEIPIGPKPSSQWPRS